MAITKDAPAVDQMVFLFDGSGNLSDIVAQVRIRLLENGNPTLINFSGQVSLLAQLTATQQSNLATIATRLRNAALANSDLALPTPQVPGAFTT